MNLMQASLDAISSGKHLSREVARDTMAELLTDKTGEISDTQISAFIMGLATKGEQVSEVAGLLDALVAVGDKVNLENSETFLDTCGTGGDKQDTSNISTLASLVAASGGVGVVKHGNIATTSQSGSADLLNAMGVNIQLSAAGVLACVKKVGFGFCFARNFHPGFGRVAKVRAQLNQRTVFNVLGPLANPANVGRQLIGVSSPDLCHLIADVLIERGLTKALVVYGQSPEGGIDEISTLGPTQIIQIDGEQKSTYEISPEDFGITVGKIADLQVKSALGALHAAMEVLEGKAGPQLDIVALNAGAGLYISDKTDSINEGYELARTLLLEGTTIKKLENLVEESNKQKLHKNAPKAFELTDKDLPKLHKSIDLLFKTTKKTSKNPNIPTELRPILKFAHPSSSDNKKIFNAYNENPSYRAYFLREYARQQAQLQNSSTPQKETSKNTTAQKAQKESKEQDLGSLWLSHQIDWEALTSKILNSEIEIHENEKLQNELQKMDKQIVHLKKGEEKLQKKIDSKKADYTEKRKKWDTEKTELSQKQKENNTLIADLKQQNSQIQESLKALEFESHGTEIENRELRQKLEKTKEQLDAFSDFVSEREKSDASQKEKKQMAGLQKNFKKIKADLDNEKPCCSKPIPIPKGELANSLKTAKTFMACEEAVLYVDGYNVVLREHNLQGAEANLETEMLPNGELKIWREDMEHYTTNIINKYPIEHALIFWDSSAIERDLPSTREILRHNVIEKFVTNADDAIVKFAEKEIHPVIVVTNDGELRKRLESSKANFLTRQQFRDLGK